MPGRDVFAELFDAVLFDMDGTLLDSSASVRRSWLGWAHEFGVSPAALRGVVMHGRPARDIVASLIGDDASGAALARIVELEVGDTAGCVPLPGALAALAAAGPRGAIVTSCSTPLALARLTAAGIAAPPLLITADDVVHGKPDPEPFVVAARRLDVDPARCLVVEDAPAGLSAAAAAGCASLAVVTTHQSHELVADRVVATLAEVTLVPRADGVRVEPADRRVSA